MDRAVVGERPGRAERVVERGVLRQLLGREFAARVRRDRMRGVRAVLPGDRVTDVYVDRPWRERVALVGVLDLNGTVGPSSSPSLRGGPVRVTTRALHCVWPVASSQQSMVADGRLAPANVTSRRANRWCRRATHNTIAGDLASAADLSQRS